MLQELVLLWVRIREMVRERLRRAWSIERGRAGNKEREEPG